MKQLPPRPAFRRLFLVLQLAAWVLAFLITCGYLAQRMSGLAFVVQITSVAFASYAAIIYGYIHWLHPRFYHRVRLPVFVALAVGFVGVVGLVRLQLETVVSAATYGALGFLNGSRGHVGYVVATGFFAFAFGLLAQAAMRSVELQRQKKELENKQLRTEMNLLKAQVQPHFLFNTLNNIYYEAYLEAPRTADLIEKLAALMRYFTEQSVQEQVPLATEIQFLQSYLHLETIRFHHPVHLDFHIDVPPDACVPPMLLMPLVENLFKHGLDKRQPRNVARLELSGQGRYLLFCTANAVCAHQTAAPTSGFGLKNLAERLRLLYGTDFELTAGADASQQQFVATLKIPVL